MQNLEEPNFIFNLLWGRIKLEIGYRVKNRKSWQDYTEISRGCEMEFS